MIRKQDAIRKIYDEDILRFNNIISEGIRNRLNEIEFTLEYNEFDETFKQELENHGYRYTIVDIGSYKIDLSNLDYNNTNNQDYSL